MPFTISGAEGRLMKFGKNVVNEIVYNPTQVLYDTGYGALLFYGLDQTPIPEMVANTVSSLPIGEDLQQRITAGAMYALVKTADVSWNASS